MQVFLPYPSFQQSVACLDKKRLGNQIWRECKTLLNGGWPNHPVAKMWVDYKPALALYGIHGIQELHTRKNIDTTKFCELFSYFGNFIYKEDQWLITMWQPCALWLKYKPPFIGNSNFHLSHRLNLLWKDPEWYSQFFDEPIPTSKPDYYWPSPQKIGSEMEPKQ